MSRGTRQLLLGHVLAQAEFELDRQVMRGASTVHFV